MDSGLLTDIIDSIVDLVDCEFEIIRTELAERFVTGSFVSNVIWVGKGCKTKILELAGALYRLGELTKGDGTPLTFVDVVRALGMAFNVEIPKLYIMRHQGRNRFKGAAQFLRRLVGLLEKDAEDLL